jgi:hypothetical protein
LDIAARLPLASSATRLGQFLSAQGHCAPRSRAHRMLGRDTTGTPVAAAPVNFPNQPRFFPTTRNEPDFPRTADSHARNHRRHHSTRGPVSSSQFFAARREFPQIDRSRDPKRSLVLPASSPLMPLKRPWASKLATSVDAPRLDPRDRLRVSDRSVKPPAARPTRDRFEPTRTAPA